MNPVTALISWAHQDPDWSAEQIHERRENVLRLAITLRSFGIDADIDLFHGNVDWTRWGPARIRDVDAVLIVVSRAWADAWEGRGNLTRNIGAAEEANVLRSISTSSRDALQDKCRLIQLPGAKSADIPDGLHGIARYRIESFDAAGPGDLEGLLRDLTHQPLYPAPPLGQVPVLPPALTHPTASASTTSPSPTGPSAGSYPGGAPVDEARRQRLQAQLAALPSPRPGEGPALPWYREWERVQRELADLKGDSSFYPGAQPSPGPTGSGQALPWVTAKEVTVEWHDRRNYESVYRTHGEYASVYVHLIVTPAGRLPSRVFAQASSRLPVLIRDRAAVPPDAGLNLQETDDAITVRLEYRRPSAFDAVTTGGLSGTRLSSTGSASSWAELPRDGMGAVIDRDRLAADIASCIDLAAAGLATAGTDAAQQVAIAAEISLITMVTDGTLDQLGNRSSAAMRGATARGRVEMDAEESLPLGYYLSNRRSDVADIVADLLVRAWARL